MADITYLANMSVDAALVQGRLCLQSDTQTTDQIITFGLTYDECVEYKNSEDHDSGLEYGRAKSYRSLLDPA